MADIDEMEVYYENVPYGEDSLPSEIHGPQSQEMINKEVKLQMDAHSLATKMGNADIAAKAEQIIRHIYKECSNAEVMKQEHASSLRSRSNWGDYTIMDEVCTEKGIVHFDEEGKLMFNVIDPRTGNLVSTSTEALSSEFHEIGDWMQTLMKAKQELVKARNSGAKSPPFDISYFTNNLIKNNWKSMVSDQTPTKDPNGKDNGYYLQEMLLNAVDENGVLQEDFNIDKYSFSPEFDTRLFTVISNELKRAFNPNNISINEKNDKMKDAHEMIANIRRS